jgi:hypothetical protein
VHASAALELIVLGVNDDVDPDQVRDFRVARHHLDERAPRTHLVTAVQRLVGIQSQVASAAVKSIAVRVEGVDVREVDAALHETRELARTWALRCTLHVVAREDYATIAAALGNRVGGFRRWLEKSGMSEKRYQDLTVQVLEALEDGPRSRDELRTRLKHKLKGTQHLFGSWGGIMKLLALEGRIVIGPRRAQETTFVHAERWFGATITLPPADEAIGTVLRRYLGAYGPATLSDFTYWAGVTAARGRAALQAIENETVHVTLSGRPHLLLREDRKALDQAKPSGRPKLLPHFDTYLMGHRDKSLILDEKHKRRVFRAAGWVSPTILDRGCVVGTWETRRVGDRVEVELAPFTRLTRSAWAALREEAELLEPGARVLRA